MFVTLQAETQNTEMNIRIFTKRVILAVPIMLMVFSVRAKSKYCETYEDFLADRWIEIPTVSCFGRSQTTKFWLGESAYSLDTGDSGIDEILRKKAFAVMKDSCLLINTHHMVYEKCQLGNGYTEAVRIGRRKLLFVATPTGGNSKVGPASFGGGIIAASVIQAKQMKNPVCYIVNKGAYDKKGHIDVKIVDDAEMAILLLNHDDLYNEYKAEKKSSKRLRASHILPILVKAGIIPEEEL